MKIQHLKKSSILVLSIIAFTLGSCKKDGCMDESAYNYNWDAEKDNGSCLYNAQLKVNVNPKFNGEAISFDSIYTNISGYRIKFSSIKFYVTYAKVGNGSDWTDAKSEAKFDYSVSNELFTADVTPGDYSQLTFDVGVDSVRNHSDPAAFDNDNPLNIVNASGMYWTWNSGYIWVVVEGRYDADFDGDIDVDDQNFSYHLGKEPYLRTNTQTVSLSLVEQMTTTVNYELNMDQFFYNSTDTLDIVANPIIHSLDTQLAITDLLTQTFNASLVLE